MSTSPAVPDYIRSLVPYVPGKPIEETQREFKIKRVVKLASNENPLGPSPKALAAIKKVLPQAHRYPDGSAYRLKQALAASLSVSPQSLILGNGSNEVIDFIVRTYCLPGDSIVTSQAAFIAYKICAQIHGVETHEIPLDAELRFDLRQMLDWVRTDSRVKIVFIANPNNPTGVYLNKAELRSFLRELSAIRGGSVLAVLDYAYWEYVTAKDLPDPLSLLKEFSQVIVLRTFSKIYGLAGLRVGYGIAAPEIVADLEKVRQPFNLNALALAAAEAALEDTQFVTRSRAVNQKGILFWERALGLMEVPFWKSQGNFILADVKRGLGLSGGEVYQQCLKRGVIFRPVANYGLLHALRLSVGKPEENVYALRALQKLKRDRG